MEEKWTPFGINWASPQMQSAFKAHEAVAQGLSRLLSVGVGIVHANRCAKIGYALGTRELVSNSETCCKFLDDCFNRICAGMPLDEFCAYIDDYQNADIGIEAAPRQINTPYMVSQRPISVGYSIEDATRDAMKASDSFIDACMPDFKKIQKNALRFLDGLGYRKHKMR
jgi:hypothetical protein